jgi:hypothetical protein
VPPWVRAFVRPWGFRWGTAQNVREAQNVSLALSLALSLSLSLFVSFCFGSRHDRVGSPPPSKHGEEGEEGDEGDEGGEGPEDLPECEGGDPSDPEGGPSSERLLLELGVPPLRGAEEDRDPGRALQFGERDRDEGHSLPSVLIM